MSISLRRRMTVLALAALAAAPLAIRAADPPATQPAAQVSPEQMLSNMLKPVAPPGQSMSMGDQPAATDTKSTTNAVAPNVKAQSLIREGSYLVDRTGRLTRSNDGSVLEFTFDADGKAMKDPPVMLLPNLKLMALEGAVKGASHDLKFRITGMVTEYNGRNYILLEKAVQVPDTIQQF